LVHDSVKVRAEDASIDARCAPSAIGYHRARNEPPRRYGPQLGDGHAVACDDDRLPALDFAQNRA
jgi:hypothetical protein